MKTINHYLVSLIIILLISCTKSHYQSIEDIPTREYYSSDIIPDSLQILYGTWMVRNTSGGIVGYGYGKDFDDLVIKKNGIFGIISDESLIAYGKLTITPKEYFDATPKLYFNSLNFVFIKSALIDLCRDSEKIIEFVNYDTLNLIAPCCDRYNIHLIRKK